MREKALKWLVCFLCGCLSPAVSALTLSDITLHSHLGEPLDARVNLSGVDKADLAGLKVSIQYTGGSSQVTVPLRHELKEDASGHYIQITTAKPIREPALTFTLEVDWAKGRYSREYSLLIDPP
jgi:pilus assembly protein FimV